jgi:hypothetical protein
MIIRPETLVRWHRAGFRCYWRWKSHSLGGRPQIETDLHVLIRWGQCKIVLRPPKDDDDRKPQEHNDPDHICRRDDRLR